MQDRATLQLPLLLDGASSNPRVLAGGFVHCKRTLDHLAGGLVTELQNDELVKQHAVFAGGAVTSSLPGCDSGARSPAELLNANGVGHEPQGDLAMTPCCRGSPGSADLRLLPKGSITLLALLGT